MRILTVIVSILLLIVRGLKVDGNYNVPSVSCGSISLIIFVFRSIYQQTMMIIDQ